MKKAISGLETLKGQCQHRYECGTCDICYTAVPTAIKAIEYVQEYQEYKDIFEGQFSKEALNLLKDKEEFKRWIERGKIITNKCSEINNELNQFKEIGTVEEFKTLKEQNARIIEILRTHHFSDDECIEQIIKTVGIYVES